MRVNFWEKNTKFGAENFIFFSEFKGKMEISSTDNLFCQKFAAVCRKIATFCPELY